MKFFIYILIVSSLLYMSSCTPDKTIGPEEEFDENLLSVNLWTLVEDTFNVVDSTSYFEIMSEVNYNGEIAEDSTRVRFFSNKGIITDEDYTIDGQAKAIYRPKDANNNLLSGNLTIVSSVGENIVKYDTLKLYLKVSGGVTVNSIEPSEGGDLVIYESETINFSADATLANGNSPGYIWKVDGEIVSTISNFDLVSSYGGTYSSGEYNVSLTIVAPGYSNLLYNWNVNIVDMPQDITIHEVIPSMGGDIVIDEGDVINFKISASDPDGGTVLYQWNLNGTVVSTDSLYNFVTNYSSAGNHILSVQMSTGSKSSAGLNWNIHVNDKNQEIVVIEILPSEGGNLYISEGESIQFSINATDPDNNPLAYEWKVNGSLAGTASSLSFNTDFLPGNGVYSAGIYEVKLNAIDINGINGNNTTTFTWYVNVADVDREIVVNQILPGESGGVYNISEGDSIRFYLDAYDPDGNPLNITWKKNGYEVATGTEYWYKADYQSSGGYLFTLEVNDEAAKTIKRNNKNTRSKFVKNIAPESKSSLLYHWNVNVANVNAPIEIISLTPEPGDIYINETQTIHFSVLAEDEDNTPLFRWKKNGNQIVSVDSTYDFTTTYQSSGTYTVTLEVYDGQGSSEFRIWTIFVNDADNPIIVNSIEPVPCECITMFENETKEFTIDAYDPDGNDLIYLWKFDNEFVSYTDDYSYYADYNSAGTHELKLTVSDNSGKNTLNYTWEIEVTDVDRPIVVNSILPTAGGSLSIFETDSITFSFDGFDPDGNDLSYSWKMNNTPISSSSSYIFRTDYNSAGTYLFDLNVVDFFSKNSIDYSWTVIVSDQAANISVMQILPTAGGNISTHENSPINFKISAADPTGEPLNYSYKLNGVEVSSDSLYTFSPDYSSAGNYGLNLKVWNNISKDLVNYDWEITVLEVDRPIVVNSIQPNGGGGLEINENEALNFSIDAYDPDGTSLDYTYKLDGEIVSQTNSYTYQSDYQSAGQHNITLLVKDQFGSKSSLNYSWNVNVLEVDRPIVINSVLPTNGGSLSIFEYETISFSVDAYDPDGNDLIYSWTLDGAFLSNQNTFTYNTNGSSAGNHDVVVIISDGSSKNIVTIEWEVEVIQQAITVVEILPSAGGSLTIWESDEVNFSVDAYDSNGGNLTYLWKLNNSPVSTTNSYNFIAGMTSAGNYTLNLTITSSDGVSTLNYVWNITVSNVDQNIVVTQVLPSPGGDIYLSQYETKQFHIDCYDPDGNMIYYLWKLDGVEVGMSSTYNYVANTVGTFTLKLSATDGTVSENEIQYTWIIHVEP